MRALSAACSRSLDPRLDPTARHTPHAARRAPHAPPRGARHAPDMRAAPLASGDGAPIDNAPESYSESPFPLLSQP